MVAVVAGRRGCKWMGWLCGLWLWCGSAPAACVGGGNATAAVYEMVRVGRCIRRVWMVGSGRRRWWWIVEPAEACGECACGWRRWRRRRFGSGVARAAVVAVRSTELGWQRLDSYIGHWMGLLHHRLIDVEHGGGGEGLGDGGGGGGGEAVMVEAVAVAIPQVGGGGPHWRVGMSVGTEVCAPSGLENIGTRWG